MIGLINQLCYRLWGPHCIMFLFCATLTCFYVFPTWMNGKPVGFSPTTYLHVTRKNSGFRPFCFQQKPNHGISTVANTYWYIYICYHTYIYIYVWLRVKIYSRSIPWTHRPIHTADPYPNFDAPPYISYIYIWYIYIYIYLYIIIIIIYHIYIIHYIYHTYIYHTHIYIIHIYIYHTYIFI